MSMWEVAREGRQAVEMFSAGSQKPSMKLAWWQLFFFCIRESLNLVPMKIQKSFQ